MKVDRVYTRNIIGTTRSSTLADAAELMRNHHVGALLVTEDPPEDANAVGFITDRDVVVQAVAKGLDTRQVSVGAVMTPLVGSISDKSDLHDALEMMRGAGVRRLIVTRGDGQVAGMLSVDDVIDGIAADITSLTQLVKSEVERERDEMDAMA
jgi:predicted transcriptional regulator